VLGLGNKARMNRPGRTKGNWSWRLEPGRLTDELARRLRDATERAGR
jgi:4-alpha-glucanotransferase